VATASSGPQQSSRAPILLRRRRVTYM
jgi:hypothetical protein